MLSDLLETNATLVDAAGWAGTIHKGQRDKATGEPYIGHLSRVARAVLDAGGTIDQGAAALLHDAIEESGPAWWPKIWDFGLTVTAIVKACSDAEPVDPAHKAPWIDRKVEHVGKLRAGVEEATYLVVAADKLDAVNRTLAAVARDGDSFWHGGVFKGGRLGTLWYYRSMSDIVAEHLAGIPLVDELVGRIEKLAIAAGVAGVPLDALLARAKIERWPEGIKPGQGGVG
jgi:(p)ppGpp synthase/HD superfamily hydrolase